MGYINNHTGYREELLSTRTVIEKNNYAVIEPDGLVKNAIPGFENCDCTIMGSPALGASFVDYLITVKKGGKNTLGFGGKTIECFFYVLEGKVKVWNDDENSVLTQGGYLYGQAREAMEIIKTFDGRAGFHCEDFSLIKWGEHREIRNGNIHSWRAFLDSRPMVAEALATEAIIMLSEETGCKAHICHISHPYVAELVRQAQKKGIDVTAETCSHYLTFTEDDVIRNGAIFKCAPPLRTAEERDKLWEYVLDGTLSCVGSDHSPCREDEKAEGENGVFSVWGGISGIQNVMQCVYSEGVVKRGYDVTLLARCLSEGPAKTFGIYGKKGAIEVGFDADIVVLDPEKEWEVTPESLLYLNQISAFVGLKGKGLPVCTVCRGEVVADNGKIVGEKGFGELVKKIK